MKTIPALLNSGSPDKDGNHRLRNRDGQTVAVVYYTGDSEDTARLAVVLAAAERNAVVLETLERAISDALDVDAQNDITDAYKAILVA